MDKTEDPLASSEEEMDSSAPAAAKKDRTRDMASGSSYQPSRPSSASSRCSSVSGPLPCTSASNSISNLSLQIRRIKNAAAAPRVLGSHETIRAKNYGSLHGDPTVDNRSQLAHLRELYDKKLNVATSFDPASLVCGNCLVGPHHILHPSGKNEPCCFVVSDQCFPAALPSSTAANCLAIIRVEDATIKDLVATFMRLTRGCDITMGTVVMISSLNHLGQVGAAAYAEDLVEAILEFRHTFGDQVRVIHGFPHPPCRISDLFTIRSMMEIESWLTSVDQRRAHSLQSTSAYFIENLLQVKNGPVNKLAEASIPLRLPANLNSKERVPYVGLGWSNLTSELPPLDTKAEQLLLSSMLLELNLEFALQLDTEPILDRLLNTPEVNRSQCLIIGGGSHASRLADALKSIHPEVVDLSVGGWKITEKSVSELASDIENSLEDEDPASTTVILHLFDNSIYRGRVDGNLTEPEKSNGRFHLRGELTIADGAAIKTLFETVMPIIRAARGASLLLIGPLPRYVVGKCCDSTTHITNFDQEDYVGNIRDMVKEVGKQLRNLCHTKRVKDVKILNPAVLMGISGSPAPSTDTMYELWGHDPVHPKVQAYKLMADRIIEETGSSSVVHSRKPSTTQSSLPTQQSSRERWTASTPTVANRRGKWADFSSRGQSGRGRHGSSGSIPWRGGYRGRFRAPWGRPY